MSARDEALVSEGRKLHNAWFDGPDMEPLDRMVRMAKVARDLHQPRTVTTAEELDTLAEGAVILSNGGQDSAQKDGEGYWYLWGGDIGLTPEEIMLPATILHDPEAQQ